MLSLRVPFVLRGVPGTVAVTVEQNRDPARWGCFVADPALPEGAALGFPVCSARISYEASGYERGMGWVQLIRATDGPPPHDFEMDPLAIYRNVNTPYGYFGMTPDLFDAPFRGSRPAMTWRARSYLCVSPDAVVTPAALPVAAFTWGFDIPSDGACPQLADLEELAVDTWAEHLAVLEAAHPGWRFVT